MNLKKRYAAALAVSGLTAGLALTATPAQAYYADDTFQGFITGGTTNVALDDLKVALCTGDCVHQTANQDLLMDYTFSENGKFSFDAGEDVYQVPEDSYAIALYYMDLVNGDNPALNAANKGDYTNAPSPAYLQRVSGDTYRLTTVYSQATQFPVNAGGNLTVHLAPAIANSTKPTFSTVNTYSASDICVGHATTVHMPQFSYMPTGTTFAYQWYYANSGSSAPIAISGATGPTYTPTQGNLDKYLYVEMKASNPTAVDWDFYGGVGTVLSGSTAKTLCKGANEQIFTPFKNSYVKSWGKKSGVAKHGNKVAIKGAKSKLTGTKISYTWYLNGKKAHSGASFKLPASSKGKKLTVKVAMTKPSFTTLSHTFSFGKVK